MKTPFIILAFLMIGSACKKSGETGAGKCTPEKKDYIYEAGRQIDTQRVSLPDTAFEYYSYIINAGDKKVFNYTLQFQDCPEVADDEGSMTIVFEIPGNVNSFQLRDSADLRRAKALIHFACFCRPSGPVVIKSGIIEGEKKSSNRWRLKASLKPLQSDPNSIDFEADFMLK